MNVSPTGSSLPPIFGDYNPNSEMDTLLTLMEGCTISHEEPVFYTYSLPRVQAILLLRFESYSKEKCEAYFRDLIHALLAYIVCINKLDENTLSTLFPEDFIELIERPATLVDAALESRVKVYRSQVASNKQEKHQEWKTVLKVIKRLGNPAEKPPVSFYVDILTSYKKHANPNADELGFALCRLGEVMFNLGCQDDNLEQLHLQRFTLLEAFSKQEYEYKTKIHLLAKVLKEDSTHPMNIRTLQNRWVDTLRDFEADFLVGLVVDASFAEDQRASLLDLCEGPEQTPASLKLADRIRTEIMLQEVPLRAFLSDCDINNYLKCLEQVLLGGKFQRFCDFSPQKLKANFLLLLACSASKEYSHCLIQLLYALPYCVDHLGGICSKELTASLSGSDEDIMDALCGRIEDFLEKEQTSEALPDEWLTVNQVLRYIASEPIAEPLVIIKKSLANWSVLAAPLPKTMALAIRVCADFAHERTYFEGSVKAISYNLLESLVDASRRHPQKSQTAIGSDPLFFIKVFFWVLNGYAEKPLNPKDASWTEGLEGQELEIFAGLVNSPRAKEQARIHLYSYYTRADASIKSLWLAIKIAPSLTGQQLKMLMQRLQEPELSLLIKELNSPIFPEESKSVLFWHCYKLNTPSSLLLASRMYKAMGISRLMLLLKTLDKLTPYSIGTTEAHKEMLKCLVDSSWTYDSEITLYTTTDPKAVELVDLIWKLSDRFWLDGEITKELCVKKIQKMINEVIRAKQRSPSPQPELLPAVLKMNALKRSIGAKDQQEALTDMGISASPGSPDPVDKN